MYAGEKRDTDAAGLAGGPEHKRPSVFDALMGDSFTDGGDGVGLANAAAGSNQIPQLPGALLQGASGNQVDVAAWNKLVAQQSLLMELLIAERNMPPAEAASSTPGAQQSQSAPARTAAATPTETKPLVRLSKLVSDKITSEGAKFNKVLHKVANSQGHIAEMEKNIELLAAGKVPPQSRPYAVPFGCEEWSSTLDEDDASLMIIPCEKTATFEELGRKLHVEYLSSQFVLQLLVEKRRLARLRTEASLANFVAQCMSAATHEREMMAKATEGINAEGLTLPEVDMEIQKACQKCYESQVRAIAVETIKAEQDKARQRDREARALEAASRLSASEVVQRGLKELLKKKGKKTPYDGEANIVDFAKLLSVEVPTGEDLKRRVEELRTDEPQKNGESPGVGRGHSNQKQKAKPKDQPKGKGKAKGKADGPSPQKGKGKGKGKTTAQSKGKGSTQPKGGGKGGSSGKQSGGGRGKSKGKGKGSGKQSK